MTTLQTNLMLSEGRVAEYGVLPKLDQLQHARVVFRRSFGLDSLPEEHVASEHDQGDDHFVRSGNRVLSEWK